jgi:L-lactate utilization protein LutB
MITDNDIKKLKTIFATKDNLKRFATKDDLKRFATKDDLKRFATKDDLKRFATKDDLKRFATKDDLKRFSTKDDLEFAVSDLVHKEEFNQKFSQFKSDIFDKLDQVIGELKTNREEREVMVYQVANHEDRIEVIETKLQIA